MNIVWTYKKNISGEIDKNKNDESGMISFCLL